MKIVNLYGNSQEYSFIYPSMNTLLYNNFFNRINKFFVSVINQINFENKQNIKSLTKPIPKRILLIFVFLKNYLYINIIAYYYY